jgi:hypothetical protein
MYVVTFSVASVLFHGSFWVRYSTKDVCPHIFPCNDSNNLVVMINDTQESEPKRPKQSIGSLNRSSLVHSGRDSLRTGVGLPNNFCHPLASPHRRSTLLNAHRYVCGWNRHNPTPSGIVIESPPETVLEVVAQCPNRAKTHIPKIAFVFCPF